MQPFNLETVLRYRKQLEDAAATQLAAAQQKLNRIKRSHEELTKEYSQLHDQLSQDQEKGISIARLVRYQERLEWLKMTLNDTKEQLNSQQKKVERERLEVVRRSRDKKVLEQLKEKQNKAYQAHIEKKETLQLDEIAVLSHDRKK